VIGEIKPCCVFWKDDLRSLWRGGGIAKDIDGCEVPVTDIGVVFTPSQKHIFIKSIVKIESLCIELCILLAIGAILNPVFCIKFLKFKLRHIGELLITSIT